MKKLAVVALCLAIGILALLFLGKKTSPPEILSITPSASTNINVGDQQSSAATTPAVQSQPSSAATLPSSISNPSSSLATVGTASSSPETNALNTALPPLTVLDNCRVAVHNYRERFGENPVGNNAEITAALRGDNPKQVNFIRDDAGLRLNGKGELLDGYGNPFFFHQISGQLMEIRSAGLDGKLWTFDDEVTR